MVFCGSVATVLTCLAAAYAVPPQSVADADPGAAARDQSLVAADNAAMNSMMSGMAVRPTGNADYDFASAMIPHHQGAIDMALAELKFGKNEQLRRIAQEIIVDQQQEIAAMRLVFGCSDPETRAPTSSMDMRQ
jgi:uncharacterized protein (DUF305 family)